MNRRAFLTGAAALGLGAAAFEPARGQSFPSNVIRIVVPYSASTPPDILARTVATALSEGEGWNVIVENKPGGVMTIGATEVLKHPADGLTLLSITVPFAATRVSFPTPSSTSRPISHRWCRLAPLITSWWSTRPSPSIRWPS
jgi:tripartite-type tricarboxylate transporter receptor subunit TctC